MKHNPPIFASLVGGVLRPHHDLLRKEVGRAAELSGSVVVEQRPPLCSTLLPLYRLFQEFRREMENHFDNQESGLFPQLIELEAALRSGRISSVDADELAESLRMLQYGQALLTSVLEEMRELTHGFLAPGDACECYGELLDVLASIQMEMDSEVRMERRLLIPEAADLLLEARHRETAPSSLFGNIVQSA